MSAAHESFEDVLSAGKAALRAGDRAQAMSLLARAVRLDPQSEQAWLFLAGAVTDPAQRRTCLERALRLNPQNEAARRGLSSLQPAAPTPQPPAHQAAPAPAPRPPAPGPQPVPTLRLSSADKVMALLAAEPAPPPPALPPEPAPVHPLAATGATEPLPEPLTPLPAVKAAPARPRRSDRLVWALVLALGLILMFGSAVYAIILVRS